jgi:putative tricarboxylic transport membrane protein
METLTFLAQGFEVALTPMNLMLVFAGCLFGTMIGALPGIGPVNGVAILLPFAYSLGLEPASAIMLLAGVYYGAEYGGRISSILVNIPGDAGAVMTTLDGHPLAQQGQGDRALAVSAMASFIGSMIALLLLVAATPVLVSVALAFGPAEYVVLVVFAFACLTAVTRQRPAKVLIGTSMGLFLATIGIDSGTGIFRFTLGIPNLFDGVDFLVVIIGVFAISEVFALLDRVGSDSEAVRARPYLKLFGDIVALRWSVLRGSIIGFFVGLLPGTGASIASTVAYGAEQRVARDASRFGEGDLRGLAAPESANNAAAVGAMVPMLTLGIPGSGTTAVMLGALLMYNVTPGPLLFSQHPEIAWGLIASMFVGNVILLALNLPLVGLFARLLRLKHALLVPLIVALTFASVYSIHGDSFDLLLMVGIGFAAYLLRRLEFPLVPIILGFVLGGLFEDNLRRALSISDGDWLVLFDGWIVGALWFSAVVVLVGPQLFRRASR